MKRTTHTTRLFAELVVDSYDDAKKKMDKGMKELGNVKIHSFSDRLWDICPPDLPLIFDWHGHTLIERTVIYEKL